MGKSLFDIEGKVVLVTGGARGIGLMLTRAFLIAGARVYITSRNQDNCHKIAEKMSDLGECKALPADLSKIEEIDRLVSDFSGLETHLDVLINNAGTTWGSTLDDFPEKGWDKVLALNLKSPFFLMQKFLSLLEKAGDKNDPSRIINVGSVDGITNSIFENISYSASKAALHHMTKIAATKLASRYITVNTIAPGPFLTDMMLPMVDIMGAATIESEVPMKRLGTDNDIGGVAVFLSSKAASYITGILLPVDGGLTAAR